MSNNKRTGFAGKGYYIALILCAAAIGITGYWYYQDNKAAQVAVQETVQQEIPVATVDTQDIPVIATQPPAPASSPTVPTAAVLPEVKKELQTMSPVKGDAITGYSMEALSYNQTTRDWRVHNGVDLAAAEGEAVCAPADGQVIFAGEDDALGYTVTIRHMDGYTTSCGSLAENLAVKTGDRVTMGQTIGYAGTTAIVETTLGSHVHFSVAQNELPADPAQFLAIGSN